jgi:hypothetical protein
MRANIIQAGRPFMDPISSMSLFLRFSRQKPLLAFPESL